MNKNSQSNNNNNNSNKNELLKISKVMMISQINRFY